MKIETGFLIAVTLWGVGWAVVVPASADDRVYGSVGEGGFGLTACTPDPRPIRLVSDLPSAPDRPFTATFEIEGEELNFEFEPYSIRAADFQVKLQVAGGGFVQHTPEPPKTVRGIVVELPGARASGVLWGDDLHLLVINPGGPDFWVEPAPGKATAGQQGAEYRFVSVAEESDEVDARDGRPMARFEFGLEEGGVFPPAPCANDGLCILELAVDIQYDTYGGGNPDRVVDLAEGLVSAINLRYEDQFAIRHHITAVVVRTDAAADPYRNDPEPLDKVVIEWSPQNQNFDDIRRDNAHLLGEGALGGPRGLTHGDAHCNWFRWGGYSGAAHLGCETVALLAHEIGHAWGIPDTHYSNCGLASASPGGCENSFSCPQAVNDITSVRDRLAASGTCLDTLVNRPPVAHDDDVVFGPEVEIRPLDNDDDPDPGDVPWLVGFTQPQGKGSEASVEQVDATTLLYRNPNSYLAVLCGPAPPLREVDRFTYTVGDGSGTDTATVSIVCGSDANSE